jgi:serine O-acetyltransferase
MDGVIVGSGAQVLGPITVGKDARVGANSVVLRDVPEAATVVGIPARVARGKTAEADKETHRFDAYGTRADFDDPMERVIDALLDKVQSMSMRVDELERRLADKNDDAWSPPVELPTRHNDDDDEEEERA